MIVATDAPARAGKSAFETLKGALSGVKAPAVLPRVAQRLGGAARAAAADVVNGHPATMGGNAMSALRAALGVGGEVDPSAIVSAEDLPPPGLAPLTEEPTGPLEQSGIPLARPPRAPADPSNGMSVEPDLGPDEQTEPEGQSVEPDESEILTPGQAGALDLGMPPPEGAPPAISKDDLAVAPSEAALSAALNPEPATGINARPAYQPMGVANPMARLKASLADPEMQSPVRDLKAMAVGDVGVAGGDVGLDVPAEPPAPATSADRLRAALGGAQDAQTRRLSAQDLYEQTPIAAEEDEAFMRRGGSGREMSNYVRVKNRIGSQDFKAAMDRDVTNPGRGAQPSNPMDAARAWAQQRQAAGLTNDQIAAEAGVPREFVDMILGAR